MRNPIDREWRQHFRRTSPDAPQGRVAVAVLLAGVVAVIAMSATALNLPWGSESGSNAISQKPSRTTIPGDAEPSGGDRITTTLIRGTTSLFVTTTTPITTTTSTTTTSTTTTSVPKSNQLRVDPLLVTLEAEGDDGTITVRTPLEGPIAFFVTKIPEGIRASTTSGRVTKGDGARVTLKLVDIDKATSGTIVIIGSDGAKVDVKVVVPKGELEITSVSISPSRPACGDPVTIRTGLSGQAESVRVVFSFRGSKQILELNQGSGSTWQGTMSPQFKSGEVEGVVLASGSDGLAAPMSFSYEVADGSGC